MMKKLFYIFVLVAGIILLFFAIKNNFFEKDPQKTFSETALTNTSGLESLLIEAYAAMDKLEGGVDGKTGQFMVPNWLWGDVYSDDAYKGMGEKEEQQLNAIEGYEQKAGNAYLLATWRSIYNAVSSANEVLRGLASAVEKGTVEKAIAAQIEAEARFLRGYYHFQAIKIWGNVPYLKEDSEDASTTNPAPPWEELEADFEFARKTLPDAQRMGQQGRPTKWAAAAFLAKVHLFQRDYSSALPILNQIIASGKFSLMPNYHDNFRTSDNNVESLFQIQVSNGTTSQTGEKEAYGKIQNVSYSQGPSQCCGFHQPSQNLVNAFKTKNGLPMLDNFNDSDVKNDEGLAASDPFAEYSGTLDPRLDYTVGRRGIPYLDWGDHPGVSWIRDQAYAGPYSPKKNDFYLASEGENASPSGWTPGSAKNYFSVVRYADVLLWAAEAEVEVGSLEKARAHVNKVRERAANPDYWVKNEDGTNAANYQIKIYERPWSDKEFARKAVRFERRLELGMEGHRFFDLVRWGIAKETLNAYLAVESQKRTYLRRAFFKDFNLRHPIPQQALDFSKGALIQNPGY